MCPLLKVGHRDISLRVVQIKKVVGEGEGKVLGQLCIGTLTLVNILSVSMDRFPLCVNFHVITLLEAYGCMKTNLRRKYFNRRYAKLFIYVTIYNKLVLNLGSTYF